MMENELLAAREGPVLILTLNRPKSLNALVPGIFEALHARLGEAATNPDIRAVILTGAGRGFCSGGDRHNKVEEQRRELALPVEQRRRPQSFEDNVAEVRRWARSIELLHGMGKPTIAMINGACAGAGLSLAAACDLRFAASSAVFASAFSKVGLPGDFGGSWLLTRILGEAKARELYFLSKRMTAAQALDFGLVHCVFDDATLRCETLKVAHEMAAWPSYLCGYIKENLNIAQEVTLSRLLDLETRNMVLAARNWIRSEAKITAVEPTGPQPDGRGAQ